MKCQVESCGNPGVAKNLCDKHYRRLKKHGCLDGPRPNDWGARKSHPLYGSWMWIKTRTNNGISQDWEDFWCFVRDVKERPSKHHTLRRTDELRPWGADNFFWKERLASSEDAKQYARAYRKKNPLAAKSANLKKNYGINIERYMEMLDEQNGVCAICNGQQDGRYKFFSVDHCHKTQNIRGLLCSDCNRGLGCFKDNPSALQKAAEYLLK